MILFVEDELLEQAILRILSEVNPDVEVSATMGKKGFNYFSSRLPEIRRASAKQKFLIALDGDLLGNICVGQKIIEWFGVAKPNNICIRFAMQEVENWFLSDRANLAKFLGVSQARVPIVNDQHRNAKESIVDIASRSSNRSIREEICPAPRSAAKVGPAYNLRLTDFIKNGWDISEARTASESLNRACAELQNL